MTPKLDTDRIPPLPRALGALLALLQSEDSSPREIANHISLEPASTIKVLRMANSAYFGGRGQVSTVSHAVLMLGIEALKSILIAAETPASFGAPEGIDTHQFWRSAFIRAAICQWAVRFGATRPANHETAFITGLLSEVGMLVIGPEHRADEDLVRQASAEVAAHWRLPAEVVDAIRGASDSADPYGEALKLARMEDLDAALATLKALGSQGISIERLEDRIDEGLAAASAAAALAD